eukprot:snap_masked-scaffold_1-processed-gene-19.33-mRNA-1 protein AED:1.00 eAED:1.00 QI:0/-1/0/0/-1/1/1/0/74
MSTVCVNNPLNSHKMETQSWSSTAVVHQHTQQVYHEMEVRAKTFAELDSYLCGNISSVIIVKIGKKVNKSDMAM